MVIKFGKNMKFRTVMIFDGSEHQVPERIQRLDSRKTHGWQLRYGSGKEKTDMFSDFTNDGSGATASLIRAVEGLKLRINHMPAPNGFRTTSTIRKTSDLPVGVSGPQERLRKGKSIPYYSFQVSIPLPSGGSTNRSVYIGTAMTITDEKIETARAKAIAIREHAVGVAESAKTLAKRLDAKVSLSGQGTRSDA